MTLTQQQIRRHYDRNAAKQDSQGWYADAAFERLIALGDFGAATNVIEAGCGTGRLAEILLRNHLPAAARYKGIDMSPVMLARAGKRLDDFAQRVTLAPGDVTLGLTARDASVDRIIATYLFDLLSPGASRTLIAEFYRALPPGGLVCLASLTPKRDDGDMTIATQLWILVQRLWPWAVGGCRPVELHRLLEPDLWHIVGHETVSPRGLTSEVLVAKKL